MKKNSLNVVKLDSNLFLDNKWPVDSPAIFKRHTLYARKIVKNIGNSQNISADARLFFVLSMTLHNFFLFSAGELRVYWPAGYLPALHGDLPGQRGGPGGLQEGVQRRHQVQLQVSHPTPLWPVLIQS